MSIEGGQDEPNGEAADAPEPVAVYHLDPTKAADFEALAAELTGVREDKVLAPLRGVLEVARLGGCQTIISEEYYSDADYSSEFSLFWSRKAEERTQGTRRLHFFADHVADEDTYQVPTPARQAYLGYSVLRPTRLGPVGRTLLKPPPEMAEANLCKVAEKPSLFGVELPVEGVPFSQQDGELLRCAHAVAWLCHYVAWSRGVIARRLTADIAQMPMPDRSKYRPLPSNGLTAEQLQGVFSAMGLPAFFYDVSDLPKPPAPLEKPREPEHGMFTAQRKIQQEREEAEKAYQDDLEREKRLRIACKYLNSGFPVVVFTAGEEENHTFTLVGWQHTDKGVQLIACDDQVGPYEPIDDVLAVDERGKWDALMIPLPERVQLNGEAAEARARDLARSSARRYHEDLEQQQHGGESAPEGQGADFADFADKLQYLRKGISIRSRLIRGRDLKAALVEQGRTGDALRLYRLARLPQWVWLVEFQDVEFRHQGQPCVVAEIVFDSTSHDLLPLTALNATLNESTDLANFRRYGAGNFSLAPGPLGGKPWPSLINPPLAAPETKGETGDAHAVGNAA
jgi:hypothetical protein